jgi:hypothetical protein
MHIKQQSVNAWEALMRDPLPVSRQAKLTAKSIGLF